MKRNPFPTTPLRALAQHPVARTLTAVQDARPVTFDVPACIRACGDEAVTAYLRLRHAGVTSDLLERHLPAIKGTTLYPFVTAKDGGIEFRLPPQGVLNKGILLKVIRAA